MIRSVLRFHPRPGGDGDLLEFFERRGILNRAINEGGCAAAEMYVRLPARDEVIVSALWNSAGDYDAWQRTADRGDEIAELESLLEPASLPLPAGEVHEVVTWVPRTEA
ncbi:MAG TPA: antibiotic biosynthesis monooxygenase [Marmoricola sp.]|nr:antibiotic biosynthesis monooxygenase [Marmoricola sp.]